MKYKKTLWYVDRNSTKQMSLFLSLLKDKCDLEIIAIFLAWLSNGWEHEMYVAKKLLFDTMHLSPTKYILEYEQKDTILKNHSFTNTLTIGDLDNLLMTLKKILITHGNIKSAYMAAQKSNKKKYSHDIFSLLLSKNTGFQTSKSKSTFFRYNLLFYWLWKYKIWDDIDMSKALIPCNDLIFENAYLQGIIKKRMKSNLKNAIILTEIAKKQYDGNFYTLYEKLI